MIKREIEIDGRKVAFKASAAIPRMYRMKYQRDIFKDLLSLDRAAKEAQQEALEAGETGFDPGLAISDLELFENVAYIMAKHADPTQPDTPEEWLDQFNVFSIYEVLPQLLELWHLNQATDVEAKKNRRRASGK